MRRPALSSILETHGALLALLLLLALGVLIAPTTFPQPLNLLNIIRQQSFIGVIAIGMTFVIILGGIDLSVGSLVALAGGLGILAMNALAAESRAPAGGADPRAMQWAPVLLGGSVMVLTGVVLGFLNGLVIAKGRIIPFIATLGAMAAYRSLALAFADGGEYRSNVPSFGSLGGGRVELPFIHIGKHLLSEPGVLPAVYRYDALPLHYPVLIFIAVAVLAHLLLRKTTFGLQVQAIGDNERAATYSAVPVSRTRILTYTLSGLTCGIGALLIASRLNSVSSSLTGQLYELDAIAAVVVGGTSMQGGRGRIWGTVVGVLILGVVNNLLNMLRPGVLSSVASTLHLTWTHLESLNVIHLQGLIKGAIIILAVLIQRSRRSSSP